MGVYRCRVPWQDWEFPRLSVRQEQSAWYTPFPYMVSHKRLKDTSFQLFPAVFTPLSAWRHRKNTLFLWNNKQSRQIFLKIGSQFAWTSDRAECRVELVPTLLRRVGCLWSVASWNLPTQITQIANCKLWPTSQSIRKTWHPNPHLAPLVGLCSVSAGYLIGGSPNKPILIIRRLGSQRSAHFYVFQNPKSWQNSYLLAICVVCVSIFSCKQSTLITKKSWIILS